MTLDNLDLLLLRVHLYSALSLQIPNCYKFELSRNFTAGRQRYCDWLVNQPMIFVVIFTANRCSWHYADCPPRIVVCLTGQRRFRSNNYWRRSLMTGSLGACCYRQRRSSLLPLGVYVQTINPGNEALLITGRDRTRRIDRRQRPMSPRKTNDLGASRLGSGNDKLVDHHASVRPLSVTKLMT